MTDIERLEQLMLDLAEHLGDARTRRMLRDLIEQCRRTNSQLILVDPTDALVPVIATMSTRFEVHLPKRTELEHIVRQTLRSRNDKAKLEIEIDRPAFETILRNLSGLTRRQIEQTIIETVAEDHRPAALGRRSLRTGGLVHRHA